MRRHLWAALLLALAAVPVAADLTNGGFESGGFAGWEADPNWVVVDNSCGYYSGWGGKWWAWSGGSGEPALGRLTSKPFVLDRDAVSLLISGWSSVRGTGEPRRWNYVTLNLSDGTEIDRVYAPDTTAFVPAWLDGSKHRGETVYVQAVDDADQPTFSMLCLDEVRTADLPKGYADPLPSLPPFDPSASVRLEDDNILVEVSRATGSITRVHDKKTGLELIREPRLAASYRFALPLPGKEPWETIEANWILGAQQDPPKCRVEADALTVRWAAPLTNYLGEEFDVSATMRIELRDGGALLSLELDNGTPYAVGETYFPVLGGLQGLGETRVQARATRTVRPAADRACVSSDIFRVFSSMSWLGDQGPEQFYAFPDTQPAPWVGLVAPRHGRSVLLSAGEPSCRPLVVRLELVPAGSGTVRDDGNWPRPEELGGLPVGVELSFVDTVGCPTGRVYRAAPCLLRFLDGEGPQMWEACER